MKSLSAVVWIDDQMIENRDKSLLVSSLPETIARRNRTKLRNNSPNSR